MKECLLKIHNLDVSQRVNYLLDMPILQGQKPSKMLFPNREDKTNLFQRLFVRRLPKKVKLMLAEDHSSTIAKLAARGDKLVTATPKAAAPVAVVTEDPTVVPTVKHV